MRSWEAEFVFNISVFLSLVLHRMSTNSDGNVSGIVRKDNEIKNDISSPRS